MLSQLQVNLWRQTEQVQDALLHRRQRRQIRTDLTRLRDHCQCYSLKHTQHQFGSWARGRPLGVARIDARQLRPRALQLPAHAEFQQAQHPQGNQQHPQQPGDPLLRVQIQRGQRQRLPFQSPEAALDQVLLAVRQHCLLQRQLRLGLIGGIHPPARGALGLYHGGLVHLRCDLHRALHLRLRGPRPVAAAHLRLLARLALQPEQPPHLILGQNLLSGRAQLSRLPADLLALASFVQGCKPGLGLGEPRRERVLLRFSPGHRAYHQPALQPLDQASIQPGFQLYGQLVALREQFRLLIGCPPLPWTPYRGQRLALLPDGCEQTLQFLRRHLGGWQWTQVVVSTSGHGGAGGQRRHLRIPDVGQAVLPQGRMYPLDLRYVQRIIPAVPAHHRGRQRQAQWIQDREVDLQLRQVRAMILAVAELQQTLRSHAAIGLGRGRIQAHPRRMQVIHPQGALSEVPLELLPGRIFTQVIKGGGQPIITEVQRPYLRAQAGAQGLPASLRPRLDMAHPVIGLRENEGHPNTDYLTQTQALPVAVGGKASVQQLRHLHPLELGQQQGHIIDSFVTDGKLLGHAESLPQFSKTAQANERTVSSYAPLKAEVLGLMRHRTRRKRT